MADNISDIFEKYKSGTLNRRDFMHKAALLSVSLGAGKLLSACSPVAITP